MQAAAASIPGHARGTTVRMGISSSSALAVPAVSTVREVSVETWA